MEPASFPLENGGFHFGNLRSWKHLLPNRWWFVVFLGEFSHLKAKRGAGSPPVCPLWRWKLFLSALYLCPAWMSIKPRDPGDFLGLSSSEAQHISGAFEDKCFREHQTQRDHNEAKWC